MSLKYLSSLHKNLLVSLNTIFVSNTLCEDIIKKRMEECYERQNGCIKKKKKTKTWKIINELREKNLVG